MVVTFSRIASRSLFLLGCITLGEAISCVAKGDEGLRFSGSLSLIGAGQHDELLDNSLNPGKKALDIPTDKFITEIRPSIKVKDDQMQIVFRPRVKATYSTGYLTDTHHDTEVAISSWVTDAFLQWTLSPELIFAYGRQNYQWGPAEVASPSNRIFHETARERGILYQPDGKNMARFNLSMGQNFSTVAMVEYEENTDEAPFMAEKTFSATGLVKPEINWNGGVDYLGIVIGGREHWHPWVGEYFSIKVPFLEGLAVYGDASQQSGSYAWYPKESALSTGTLNAPPTTTMELAQSDNSSLYNFWVGGARYDFVGGSILRLEYIRHDAGYTTKERELLNRSFDSRDPNQRQLSPLNLSRFMHSGLELPGQEYWFSSLHSPEVFGITDLTLYMRVLYAVADATASTYGSLEYQVGKSGTLSGSVLTTSGDKNGELSGTVSPSYVMAYRMDW